MGETLSCRPHVSHIHFGGGTPNIIGAGNIKILIEKLGVYFEIDKNTQIDIEIDPRLLNPETINDLSIIGINRVSLGMQDFNPDVQNAVNRIQPFEKAQEDVLALREAGIRNINFDMMIGLPLQTRENIQLNAERAISLSPDRLAVFAYAHVPWMKKHQKLLEKYPIPGTRERHDMNGIMADSLLNAGYEAIGIDHFAHENDPLFKAKKTGALHRNFQGYTCDQAETIIGLGISSISSFKGAFVQNTTDPKEYRDSLKENLFPIRRGRVLTDDDLQRSRIIEQIMCYFETKLEDVENPDYNLTQLDELKRDKIIRFDGDQLVVTEEGKSFARVVASCFDPYYKLEEGRHARAV